MTTVIPGSLVVRGSFDVRVVSPDGESTQSGISVTMPPLPGATSYITIGDDMTSLAFFGGGPVPIQTLSATPITGTTEEKLAALIAKHEALVAALANYRLVLVE